MSITGSGASHSEKKSSKSTASLDMGKDSSANAHCEAGDPISERRTMRRVDLRLLPILAMLYAFALIDRINLGQARTAGMGTDLKLHIGARFSIATVLYFVPYILLQIPGNMMLRIFGARNWLTISVIGWGAVQTGMAFVPTWGYLTLCRILLGVFEAGFFPAIVYIITSWYTRHEVQKASVGADPIADIHADLSCRGRLAFLYMSSITVSGFSPILAYALSLLDGKRGIAGWSWIFLIEGVITLFLGVLGFYFLPDFPDKNTFLKPEQTAFVLQRVEDDRGDSVPDEITTRKVLHHLGDWTLWAYGIMFACSTLPQYLLAYFISLILKGMGYSRAMSLLLSAPPYGPAFVSALFFAWLSDKTKHRAGFIAIQATITLVGTALTAFGPSNSVKYFGTFLINAGSAGCIPGILAYGSNNVVSQSKRSVQSAMTVAWGGIGGIIASTVFREKDAPRYIPGLWVTIGAQFVLYGMLVVTTLHFRRLNRLSRQGKITLEGQPGFYYTL